MPRLNTVTVLVLLAATGLAHAASGKTSNAQERTQARAQITLERKDSEARLANNEKICYQHFAVTDCLQKVRRQYNTEERCASASWPSMRRNATRKPPTSAMPAPTSKTILSASTRRSMAAR